MESELVGLVVLNSYGGKIDDKQLLHPTSEHKTILKPVEEYEGINTTILTSL